VKFGQEVNIIGQEMNKTQRTKRIGKGKVLADVKRTLNEVRGTGPWLNKNITFETSLRLNGNHDEKLKSILKLLGLLYCSPIIGP